MNGWYTEKCPYHRPVLVSVCESSQINHITQTTIHIIYWFENMKIFNKYVTGVEITYAWSSTIWKNNKMKCLHLKIDFAPITERVDTVFLYLFIEQRIYLVAWQIGVVLSKWRISIFDVYRGPNNTCKAPIRLRNQFHWFNRSPEWKTINTWSRISPSKFHKSHWWTNKLSLRYKYLSSNESIVYS